MQAGRNGFKSSSRQNGTGCIQNMDGVIVHTAGRTGPVWQDRDWNVLHAGLVHTAVRTRSNQKAGLEWAYSYVLMDGRTGSSAAWQVAGRSGIR
jgi:hypothetical protein